MILQTHIPPRSSDRFLMTDQYGGALPALSYLGGNAPASTQSTPPAEEEEETESVECPRCGELVPTPEHLYDTPHYDSYVCEGCLEDLHYEFEEDEDYDEDE